MSREDVWTHVRNHARRCRDFEVRCRGLVSQCAWIGCLGLLGLLMPPVGDASAQTSIRAHYAHGQVWVVWEASDHAPDFPQTFAIFGSDSPITALSDAGVEQVGRLFEWEYFPGALRYDIGADSTAAWVIPDSSGTGTESLGPNDGLFVETVHAAGDRFYAVVPWDDPLSTPDSTIVPGINATTDPATALFGPTETVTCHVQGQTSPLAGYTSYLYCMWADGRDDPSDRRPDIPVCANAAKNGMPSVFIVSGPDDLGAGPHPAVYWLHGGGGHAGQSTPENRPTVTLLPENGLLIAHNDDFVRWVGSPPLLFQGESNSWWFGWSPEHDPFDPTAPARQSGEVIVNYTQRRIRWIHDWLVDQGMVDPVRASIQGHSAGAAGTTALAKAYPNGFATCTIFNNGFGGPDAGNGLNLFGEEADALLCNLKDSTGAHVLVYRAFDLNTPISDKRDLPFWRTFHGKNDQNGTMAWDPFVVEEYARADSLGWGMHLYWDLAGHGLDTGGHWHAGAAMDQQTERDNVAYQYRYRSDQSFPAFYNHRAQPGALDPGDGSAGNLSGDDYGTWGGFHDWETDTIVDTPVEWQATIFLIDGSPYLVDNCSGDAAVAQCDSLTSDLAVRKPQQFKPNPGQSVDWWHWDENGIDLLASGTVVVGVDGLVRLPGIATFQDPRRTRIECRLTAASVEEPWEEDLPGEGSSVPGTAIGLDIAPSPFSREATIEFRTSHRGFVGASIFDAGGRLVRRLFEGVAEPGTHTTVWNGRNDAGTPTPPGVYWVRVQLDGNSVSQRVVRLR